MSRTVDVALLPAEAAAMEAGCYLVVDVLRATSTVVALLEGGATTVVAAADIAWARAEAARRGALLVGEVGGLRPEGFDHGNSPLEIVAASVAGRGAVLYTTNGTRALCAVAGRGTVAAAAICNAGAAARFAASFERVVILCAGEAHGTRFALEDFAAAGVLVQQLLVLDPQRVPGDAATVAMALGGGQPQRLVSESAHAADLRRLGLEADVEFAARLDTATAVPVVRSHGDGWAELAAE